MAIQLIKKIKLLSIAVFMVLISSCSYEKTELTLGSAFDSTWQFNSSNNYVFDSNLVEFSNGRATLKPLDLTNSGEDLSSGDHQGTLFSNNQISLLTHTDIEHSATWTPNWLQASHYYKMNGNLDGELGPTLNTINTNGTGLDHLTGHLDKALSFDGIDDGVFFSNSAPISQMSVSTWVKLDSFPNSFPRIFNVDSLQLWVNQSGSHLRFRAHHSVTSGQWSTPNNSIELGKWHHIALTYDATSNSKDPIIFIDGVQQTITEIYTPSGALNNTIDNFYIGNRDLEDRAWDGEIDDFIYWPELLTTGQITAIYNQQKVLKASDTSLAESWTPQWNHIIGYWKMDGNWQDSSENGYHGTPVNGPILSAEQKIGSSSAQFDGSLGSLQYMDMPSNVELDDLQDSSYSLSAWVKPTGLPPNNSTDDSFFSIVNKTGFHEGLTYRHDGLFRVVHYQSSNVAMTVLSGPKPPNIYYFVVGVVNFTTNTLQLFLDGELIGTTTFDGTSRDYGAQTWKVGLTSESGVNRWPFLGHIDDVALWKTTLTPSDVKTIYDRQKQKYASHYDSEIIDLGNATSAWPDLSWSTNLPFGKELVGDFNNDGVPDSESSSDYFGLTGNLQSGLLAYWDFNEKFADSVLPGNNDYEDKSGNNSHIDESGGVEFNANGKLMKSIKTDGVDDFLSVNMSPSLVTNFNDDYSISMWILPSINQVDLDSTLNRIFTRSTPSGHEILSYRNSTHAQPYTLVYSRNDGATQNNINSTITLVAGEFNHILLMKYNGQRYMYINGSLDSQEPDTNSLNETFTVMSFGALSTNYFTGNIDEVAIWSRGLIDTEIQELYRRGANRVKLQVKNCIDPSCNCKSYNVAPAGSTTDCDGDGVLNATDSDDIYKAEFVGPGGDGTTYYSELYNRLPSDITFNCALNTTDSNPGICVEDEISITGSSKPTGPEFLNIDYTQFVSPSANRYAQYRVYMEADDNTVCGGEPCLPELTSVNLNPANTTKYASEYVEVKPKSPINFTSIMSANISADSCASFRLHRSPNSYYHDGTSWTLVSDESHRNIASEVTNNIKQFATQFGAGELEVIGYLRSNPAQTDQCTIDEIDINYN